MYVQGNAAARSSAIDAVENQQVLHILSVCL